MSDDLKLTLSFSLPPIIQPIRDDVLSERCIFFESVILATAEPLKTTSSRVMTVEGPDSSSDGALMINVLRTDDLIADHIPSKPLLLEKISHLVIRVEIKANQCLINGHPMPLTHAHSDEMLSKGMMTEDTDPHTGHRQLKMTVEMKQVQTLKLPKDSPLVPLGLSKPELLQISEQYMAEGVVGAVLSISEEPVEVDVSTVDGQKLDAQAIKITIGIQVSIFHGLLSLHQIRADSPSARIQSF